jgi:hypothetical protein
MTAARTGVRRDAARPFYFRLGIVLAGIVFLAFSRNYWAPLAQGTLDLPRAVHIHAVLFFLWMIFFVVQTTLVARGRTSLHRELGLLGISIATAMVITGVVATTVSLKAGLAGPNPEFARRANVLGMFAMALFSIFIALAIANIRRPELHKRSWCSRRFRFCRRRSRGSSSFFRRSHFRSARPSERWSSM